MSEVENKNDDTYQVDPGVLQKMYDRVTEIEEEYVRAQETKDEPTLKKIRGLIRTMVEKSGAL